MISIKTNNFFITLDKINSIKFDTKDGEIIGFSDIRYSEDRSNSDSNQGTLQGPGEGMAEADGGAAETSLDKELSEEYDRVETVADILQREERKPRKISDLLKEKSRFQEAKPLPFKPKFLTHEKQKKYEKICNEIVGFIKDRGGETTIRYGASKLVGATKEAIEEASAIRDRCGAVDNRTFKQCIEILISSGRVERITKGKAFIYKLLEGNTEENLKSLCPHCGGWALIPSEAKYATPEEYTGQEEKIIFSCLLCGEQVETEKEVKEAA